MVELKDILISARQESHRMRHHYLGAEHLCIALLGIKGGLLPWLLTETGLSADYVVDAVRRKTGKGSRHRLWSGVPNTPRVEVILTLAQEIAFEAERLTISERDLLLAILEERESLPLRVLSSLGTDLDILVERVRQAPTLPEVRTSFLNVEFSSAFGLALESDALFVLRQMFHDYDRLRVESRLVGGHTDALLLLVVPIREDGREDAPLVVKIGPTDAILDEAQRYDRYIRTTLPPMTARMEDRPTAPEMSELAGIRYTLAANGNGVPYSLRNVLLTQSSEGLGVWLRQALYDAYAPRWWSQKNPYRFEAWQEYDAMLPPVLELELMEANETPEEAFVIRYPLRRNRLTQLQYGQIVSVENFVVYRIDRAQQTITLALGHGGTRALQMTVRGVDFSTDTYFRGELVEKLIGRVVYTRQETLLGGLAELYPDFEPRDTTLKYKHVYIPNPFTQIGRVLDLPVLGSMSIIHGDLHLGNIMMGIQNTAMLIDFAQARDGHTLFDWAVLEMSLLAELLLPFLDDTWNSVRDLLPYLVGITHPQRMPDPDETLAPILQTVRDLRSIISEQLATSGKWEEYWIALAVVTLRASLWATMSVPQRRLMAFVSGLAIGELDQVAASGGAPDETEFTNHTQ